MAFVDIPTLNGGHVHVAADSVYRITRSIQGGDGSTFTRVDFGGEFQLTQMSADEVARLLASAGAKLAQLTAPDGTEVFLSVGAVTAVRAADPHIDPPGASAVLTVADHRQAVQQTQEQVEQRLAASAVLILSRRIEGVVPDRIFRGGLRVPGAAVWRMPW